MDDKEIKDVLSDLRDELRDQRKARNHPKRWFEKDPFKGMLTHAMSIVLAIGAGYGLHKCTGEPITIEASNAPKTDTAVAATSPAATAEAVMSVEIVPAASASGYAFVAPAESATATKTTKTTKVTVVAVASATPQAFHAEAPAPAAAAAPELNSDEPAEPPAAPVKAAK